MFTLFPTFICGLLLLLLILEHYIWNFFKNIENINNCLNVFD